MIKRQSLVLQAILVAACIVLFAPGRSYALDDSALQRGDELFHKHCSVCHGEEAVGQDPSQPSGGWDEKNNRLAPALNGTGHAWHHPPSLLYQYIKEGSIDKASPMPAFGDQLSDNDIKSIIWYIQSLWPDEIMDKYEDRFRTEKE